MATSASPSPAAHEILTPVQQQAIELIAAGLYIREVAEECKIHRNTIGNWRRTNPAFARALADAQYDRVLYWRDAAEEHAAQAIETIADLLTDRKAPAGVRLRAALAMLNHAITLPPAASVPDSTPVLVRTVVHSEKLEKVHNPAQPGTSIPTKPPPELPNPKR